MSVTSRRDGAWCLLNSSLLGALLLVLGCTVAGAPDRTGEEPLPALVARRVTAVTERQAVRLVRLETEHETFLTTPEHPFATPRFGWIHAGQLVPGDRVVSERLGALRLLSVRSEPAARPVTVFNLSVASSHAYFVGTARVLVHNTNCGPPSESLEAAIERLLREREEINREIDILTKTNPTSPRIAELKTQRVGLRRRLRQAREAQRSEQVAASSRTENSRRHFESESEAARKSLDEAQRELTELERRSPTSEAEEAEFAARRKELKKQIPALTFTANRTSQILAWLQELVAAEKETPATDADRQALEAKMQALRSDLNQARKRWKVLKHARRKRAVPHEREAKTQYERALRRRLLRLPVHLADTERPRDPLERLEEELAGQLQEAPAGSRDARVHHLTDQIETMKKQIQARRKTQFFTHKRRRLELARKKLHAEGGDTRPVDERIQEATRGLQAVEAEGAQLRARQRLLGRLDKTPWTQAPESVDPTRLRDFERQLAELIGTGAVNERQSPPATRAADLQSRHERLQQELREERAALEVALSALANEHAHIQTTQAGSSNGPSWQDRLRAIQAEQGRLRANWRAHLQARLDSALRELHLLRSVPRFHDEEIEAELAREVALLERELQMPG